MAFGLFAVLFMLQASALAQSTASSSTATPSSLATGSSQVLRPAQDEHVTYASPYTIRWTPPNISGSISIELWDTGREGIAYSFTEVDGMANQPIACDGYLTDINCGKIAQRIPNTGEHVWDVTSTLFGFYSFSGQYTFYLAIYIQQASGSDLPEDSSPWYVKSGTFTIITNSSLTGSSMGTSASSSTTSSTGSSEPTSLSPSSGRTSNTGTTVSKNAGERMIVGQDMWKVLCLLSTFAIW